MKNSNQIEDYTKFKIKNNGKILHRNIFRSFSEISDINNYTIAEIIQKYKHVLKIYPDCMYFLDAIRYKVIGKKINEKNLHILENLFKKDYPYELKNSLLGLFRLKAPKKAKDISAKIINSNENYFLKRIASFILCDEPYEKKHAEVLIRNSLNKKENIILREKYLVTLSKYKQFNDMIIPILLDLYKSTQNKRIQNGCLQAFSGLASDNLKRKIKENIQKIFINNSKSKDVYKKMYSAYGLLNINDVRGIPILIDLLDTHPNSYRVNIIKDYLKKITKVDKIENKENWIKWWKKNKKSFKIEPLHE